MSVPINAAPLTSSGLALGGNPTRTAQILGPALLRGGPALRPTAPSIAVRGAKTRPRCPAAAATPVPE